MSQELLLVKASANYEPHTIKFFDDESKDFGKLAMKDGGLTFTGNANEAAEVFFRHVCDRTFQLTSQIKELKQENVELLEALRAIVSDDMADHKSAQEFGGFVLPDELRWQAVTAIAKAERRNG